MGVSKFQAIVMAGGKGSRMTELTARKPKCLLPIGNLPMVWYPIRFLEKSGFQEVTVVVAESARVEVQAALERAGGLDGVRCDVLGIPATADDWGTADTLRHLADAARLKPEADLVVVPCDLVTDFDLREVLDLFRQHDASVASLFFRPSPTRLPAPATAPGPRTKEKPERDLVALEPDSSRLVFVASASDYEASVCIAGALLRRHGGRVRVHSRLLDAHVYVLRRWLCRYLQQNRSVSTLKGELVPYVVKRQMSHRRPAVDKPKTDLVDPAQEEEKGGEPVWGVDTVRCYTLLAPDTAYATRANTLLEYCRANKEVVSARGWGVSGQVLATDSVAGPGAVVAERTAIRSSAIGPLASVGPRSRLSDTVLMAGAQIGQNCVLSNCVVGEGAVVGDGCHLTDCLVGDKHTVSAAEKHSNEVLTDDDHLIEIV